MPYRTPKHIQAQKEAKQRHILDAALRLFAEKGYISTSVQDICRTAGVSVGSLYFYFPNKESIYEAVYQRIKTNFQQAIDAAIGTESDLKQIIRKSLEVAASSSTPDVYEARFFVTNSYLASLKSKRDDLLHGFAKYFQSRLDEAVQRGQLRSLNTELAAVTVIYGSYQLIRYWNLTGGKTPAAEIVDFLYDYTVRGLGLEV